MHGTDQGQRTPTPNYTRETCVLDRVFPLAECDFDYADDRLRIALVRLRDRDAAHGPAVTR
jgi:hypothetical protein